MSRVRVAVAAAPAVEEEEAVANRRGSIQRAGSLGKLFGLGADVQADDDGHKKSDAAAAAADDDDALFGGGGSELSTVRAWAGRDFSSRENEEFYNDSSSTPRIR